MTRSISVWRPITGSSLSASAKPVRSVASWSSKGVLAEASFFSDPPTGGAALALPDQPEQQVLGADVVVAHPPRFLDRQLQDLFGGGGQFDLAAGVAPDARQAFDRF